ncbi:unnamed protein product, partial [Lymnaea stagnalis]
MEGIKHGQRLLMALYPLPGETAAETVTLGMGGVLAAVGGLIGLLFVVLLCACKEGEKNNDESAALQERRDQNEAPKADGAESKLKAIGETVVPMTNGGPTTSSTLPGHSRQASASSVHNMRPTSLRELPEPPVSNHTRNASLSGIEASSNSMKGAVAPGGPEYAYPQHLPQHGNRNTPGGKNSVVGNGITSEKKVKSHSDGYDHLRPKLSAKPTDYDSLADHDNAGEETPMSDTGSAGDGHYSHLREEEYAIVKDVKAKPSQSSTEHFSGMKAKPLSPVSHYSQVTDEDPYNHIGDSDGAVSASFIHRLKQSNTDMDPYATCQDTAGELQSILEERGAVGGGHHLSTGGRSPLSPPKSFDDYRDRADEYAVVNKTRGDSVKNRRSFNASNDDDNAQANTRPPEPPRMYDIFDDDGDTFPLTAAPGHKREHKYSKVTARESLASMTERNALNPYEMVPDLPENTYATVEGGSGDGVMMRSGSVAGNQENRLSQSSDTYAEIGISGGGLSTSVISNSSSIGGNNNNSSSSGAPIPPSLDSLHMMTKSQTSSEGDRLSDRHLASPEDTGLNPTEDDDSGDSMEDGYSTLKRTDGFSPRSSALPNNQGGPHATDEESGEVTLISSYQSVKDCISDNEAVEDLENDPNYESVDETRAKVAALRARERSSLDSRNSEFKSGAANGAAVVKVLQSVSSLAQGNKSEQSTNHRRRLDHDYEEVDITPPSSPLSSHRTMSAALPSSHQNSAQAPSHFSNDTNFKDDREGTFDSHMYEELSEVRAKKSDIDKTKKGTALGKSGPEDRKKGGAADKSSAEDKKKSSNM